MNDDPLDAARTYLRELGPCYMVNRPPGRQLLDDLTDINRIRLMIAEVKSNHDHTIARCRELLDDE